MVAWCCLTCTYMNPSSFLACKMCGTTISREAAAAMEAALSEKGGSSAPAKPATAASSAAAAASGAAAKPKLSVDLTKPALNSTGSGAGSPTDAPLPVSGAAAAAVASSKPAPKAAVAAAAKPPVAAAVAAVACPKCTLEIDRTKDRCPVCDTPYLGAWVDAAKAAAFSSSSTASSASRKRPAPAPAKPKRAASDATASDALLAKALAEADDAELAASMADAPPATAVAGGGFGGSGWKGRRGGDDGSGGSGEEDEDRSDEDDSGREGSDDGGGSGDDSYRRRPKKILKRTPHKLDSKPKAKAKPKGKAKGKAAAAAAAAGGGGKAAAKARGKSSSSSAAAAAAALSGGGGRAAVIPSGDDAFDAKLIATSELNHGPPSLREPYRASGRAMSYSCVPPSIPGVDFNAGRLTYSRCITLSALHRGFAKAGIDPTELLPPSDEVQYGDALFLDDYRGVGLYYAGYRIEKGELTDGAKDKKAAAKKKRSKGWSAPFGRGDGDDSGADRGGGSGGESSEDDGEYVPSDEDEATTRARESDTKAKIEKAMKAIRGKKKKGANAVGPDHPRFVDRMLIHALEEYGYGIPFEFADAPLLYFSQVYDLQWFYVDPTRYDATSGVGPLIAKAIRERLRNPTYTGGTDWDYGERKTVDLARFPQHYVAIVPTELIKMKPSKGGGGGGRGAKAKLALAGAGSDDVDCVIAWIDSGGSDQAGFIKRYDWQWKIGRVKRYESLLLCLNTDCADLLIPPLRKLIADYLF